jgi:hypothetical protein
VVDLRQAPVVSGTGKISDGELLDEAMMMV